MPPAIALLAVSFALGIFIREIATLAVGTCCALALVSSLGLIAAALRGRLLGVAAMAQVLCLGLLAAALAWPRAPVGLRGADPWEVSGRVAEPPSRAFDQTHVLVDLERVSREGASRRASGRVRLSLPGDPPDPLLPGDVVRFRARLMAPHGYWEPDAPNPARRSAERGVIAVAGLAEAGGLARMIEPPPGWSPSSLPRGAVPDERRRWPAGLRQMAGAWQQTLLERVGRHLAGERRALVESLVLGERAHISHELDDAFRKAGVTHVLSVSGLHLAIAALLFVVGLRWILVRITPLSRRVAVHRIAAAFALPATLAYALITGAAVATMRSLVVTWVFLVGAVAGRSGSAPAAFAVSGLILLGASPLALFDPSFQLSFAAALGASLLAPRVMRALGLLRQQGEPLARRLLRVVVALVATSAAAIVATAPITAWHFAQVAPIGLVSNVLVVPLAELWVLPMGLAGCAISSLWDPAAGVLFGLAGVGAAGMAQLARFFAAVSPDGTVPAPTPWEALLYYALVAALLLSFEHRRARRALPALALAFALCLSLRTIVPRVWPTLTLHFLDVGQGDACLIELPDGKTMLVDGGGSFNERFDPGSQILVPWLARHGTRRIDYLVLTHPHPDHANGLAAVVDRFPVGEVWTNGATSSLPGLLRLEAAAKRRGLSLERPHAIAGDATVEVLHPLDAGVVRPRAHDSENDGSIVLRLRFRGRTVLMTGDIERRAEARLCHGSELHPAAGQDAPLSDGRDAALELHADVVKAPHHGSPTSSTGAFVDATRPKLVVISVGAENRWGFPNADVLARWHAVGAETLRTDEQGAVTVRIGPRGSLSVTAARGGAESR